jgi:lysophospholipase L1-like esterase
LTQARPGGRFERHPRLTGAGLLAGALLLVELALRIAAPAPLRFAHEMRRVHRYSRTSRVELRPSQAVRLRLLRSDGQALFDFQLTTGSEGFRVGDAERAALPAGGGYLHAIGDSYTMGWGVDAASAYPARLARRTGPELRVLNLGVDGFGAIAATAKSRALAERYPPTQAVYLFCPNDLDDDVRAAAVAGRGSLTHAAHEALDALRRASYLAGVPFALRYRLQFRAGPAAPGTGTATGTETAAETATETATETTTETTTLDPTTLLLPEPAALPAPPEHHPTFAALLAYRDFLAARGARLLVLVLSNQAESLMAYRFCREQGIEAHLFDVPPALRLPDEGHFSAAGNEAVAALVERLLREGRDAPGS